MACFTCMQLDTLIVQNLLQTFLNYCVLDIDEHMEIANKLFAMDKDDVES